MSNIQQHLSSFNAAAAAAAAAASASFSLDHLTATVTQQQLIDSNTAAAAAAASTMQSFMISNVRFTSKFIKNPLFSILECSIRDFKQKLTNKFNKICCS
jgi:hypothetical protein